MSLLVKELSIRLHYKLEKYKYKTIKHLRAGNMKIKL